MGGKGSTLVKRELSLTVCTWNLGNETPTTGWSWIGPDKDSDIYAVGCQEAVYEKRSGYINTEQDLFLSIHRALGEDKYDVVDCQSLTPRTDKTYKTQTSFKDACASGDAKESGIRMIVLMKKSLIKEGWWPEDSDVLIQTCGRLGGVSGNKGGISITLRIGETWVSFVSAHMAAHTHENEKRVEDFGTIMGGLHPPDGDMAERQVYQKVDVSADKEKGHGHGHVSLFHQPYIRNVELVTRSHIVFAMGDFNFRLEPMKDGAPVVAPDDLKEVQEDYELRQWESMASYDQLKREQASGRVFHGFQEMSPGYPRFMPTFKLKKAAADSEKAEDGYNTKRVPSWTDRILWRSIGPQVTCHTYASHPEYQPNTSDHTPVTATFTFEAVKGGQSLAHGLSTRLRATMSSKSPKKRELTLSNFCYKPNLDHILPLFDADTQKASAAMAGVQLLVSVWHPCSEVRTITETVKWSPGDIAWKNTVRLESTEQVDEIANSPLILCVRNQNSEIKKLRLFGEGMLDLRTLRSKIDGKGGKAKFEIELYQRGTPRGTLSGEFQMHGC